MSLASELVAAHLPPNTAAFIGGVPSTIASAGSTQGTATAITSSLVTATGATGATGVILPAAMPGDSVTVYTSAATNALLVYPPTGAAINAASANAAYSLAAQTAKRFICLSATQWIAA